MRFLIESVRTGAARCIFTLLNRFEALEIKSAEFPYFFGFCHDEFPWNVLQTSCIEQIVHWIS